MTHEEIEKLIGGGETLTVEFKSDIRRLSDHELVEALAAMANTCGGVLLEGVEDKTGEVTGLNACHLDVEGIVPLVENMTVPALRVCAEKVEMAPNVWVGVITVRKSQRIISTSDGKYLRRRLNSNGDPEVVAIRPADMVTWQSSLGLYDPSAVVLEGVSADELDPLQRVRIRQAIEKYNGDKALLKLSDDELDAALGLCEEIGGIRHPTVTGVLLLGTESLLRREIPSHEVAFQVLKSSRVKVNEFRHKPLLEVFEEFGILFGGQYAEDEIDVGLFRVPIPNFDKTAFREAFVNALVHRDYSVLGAVHIQFDDLGLTIASPGGFIEGVDKDTILTASPKSRNPRLADAVKRIGLAERTGRGVDRIFEGLLRYGRLAPDYSESNSSVVKVRMFEGKADVLFLRMLLNREDRGVDLPIDSLLVLSVLRDGEMTLSEIAGMLAKGESMLRGTLGRLLSEGMIEQRLEGRTHVYFLGKSYHQAVGREVDYTKSVGIDPIRHREMIIEFIGHHGRIVCSQTMDLCGLKRSKATGLLKEMVDSRKIVKNGMGRWTYYTLP